MATTPDPHAERTDRHIEACIVQIRRMEQRVAELAWKGREDGTARLLLMLYRRSLHALWSCRGYPPRPLPSLEERDAAE